MAEDARIGTEVAGYRIEAAIGRGGMGAVYLAEHLRLGRKVALKLLTPELAGNEKFRERFLRESRVAASIDHPNIVPIYDADEADGVLFIAMRYVEGTDLRGLISAEGRLDPVRTASVLEQLCDALDTAHARGLVHRDVKPGNILVVPRRDPQGRDHVYLGDFGLTKRALSVSGLTQTGQLVGTIDYVAPEQVKGDPVDGRADLYSTGCVIYQCLMGEVPFPRDLEVAVLWAHVQEPPPSLVDQGFPKAIDQVVQKALAKDPKDRFATGEELSTAFSRAVGLAPSAGRMRVAKRRRLRSRRSRLLVAAAAIAAVALGAGVVFSLSSGGTTYVPGVDTVTRIDADRDAFAEPVPVGEQPTGIAFADGDLWVTNLIDQTITRIDPSTGNELATKGAQGFPTGIAGGPDGLFITTGFGTTGGTSQVLAVNLNTNQVQPFCEVPSGTEAIAEGGGFVWVAVANRGEVWRIPPSQCDPTKISLSEGADPQVIAWADEPAAVWSGDGLTPTVFRVDPSAADDVAPFGTSDPPTGLAFGAGSVWITVGSSDRVVRLDPKTGQTQTLIDQAVVDAGCDQPSGIAVASDGVWVGCYGSRRMILIDPETDTVVRTLAVRGAPDAVVADADGDVWVTVHAP
jgi:serine/threonine-protein kinase